VPLPGHAGWVPLEQVIADNLGALFPRASELAWSFFRVTRGAKDDPWADQVAGGDVDLSPGAIIEMVTAELTARKYAGVVRLEVGAGMPASLRDWLAAQLGADPDDVIATPGLLSLGDLMELPVADHAEQRYPPHEPVTHPRLRNLDRNDPSAIFDEIRRGDILVHLPYHSFDTSILRFLQSAAVDPAVLAIKLTIYRTGRRSPIIQALKEAARAGKQVAVLVEITARFDEAPNISWGKELEQAGAHVAYGVERVKTHVKLALVVRQEPDGIRRYIHVGTGNYHEGTARLYEDLGLLSADRELAAHAAAVFNELTAGIPAPAQGKLLVAPHDLRERLTALIRREAEHARAGRPCGIRAKMNQLQDPQMIRELYRASLAGIYGIFGGLILSYAVLLLGMAHNWFGISPVSYTDTAKAFTICWLVTITTLIVATLRLPVIFTALFTLVDLTLLLSLLQVIHNSTGLQKATGWSALAVAAVGIYLFISTSFHATGGRELPAGKPILHG
jgi:polyphosphate kinase